MKLSIVVPCYNEEKNIPHILERFAIALKPIKDAELILVNNGSTDNSAAVFAEHLTRPSYAFVRVVTVKNNVGYGHGIMTGVRAAKGEVLSWTHADLQTDPVDVIAAYEKFQDLNKESNKVLIKGRRIKRRFGEWAFTLGMSTIATATLLKPLFDVNAQPKLFHRSFLRHLKNAPEDFSLDLYLLYLAKHKGYELHTVPVRFGKRLHGESKWAFSLKSRWKTVLRTIKYIFALRKSIHGNNSSSR